MTITVRKTFNRLAAGALTVGLAADLVTAPAGAAAPPAVAPPPVASQESGVVAPADEAAGSVAAPASATATPAAALPAVASQESTQLQGPWRAPDLIFNWYGDDGVKGKIKNFTSHTVKISDPLYGREGAYYLLAPGGEVTFYNSKKFEYRDGYNLLLAGHGAYFDIRRADGGPANYLTLSDPYVGRPDTYFTAYPIKTLRTGWSQGESHHEVTSHSSIWIKREKDGWSGGRENKDNSDWAVFTVHIDKI